MYIPSYPEGGVDLSALKKELLGADTDKGIRQGKGGDGSGRVAAVCLTHVPTNGGTVNDASAVAQCIRSTLGAPEVGGPLFVLDACQSVGQMELNVETLGCDIMAGTSRKWLRGPRGVGFLYVRAPLLDKGLPCFGWFSPSNCLLSHTEEYCGLALSWWWH